MKVRLPPPRTMDELPLVTTAPGLMVSWPSLTKSLTLALPMTLTRPAEVLVPLLQFNVWAAVTVSCPLLVKFETVAGPVTLTVVLLAVVDPATEHPPWKANIPPPRRNPPPTLAPF